MGITSVIVLLKRQRNSFSLLSPELFANFFSAKKTRSLAVAVMADRICEQHMV